MKNLLVERTHPSVVTVRMKEIRPGWSQRFLLRSDAHHDNALCDQEMERRHLEEAKATGAGIIDCGDCMCLMQGRWDKRADQDQMIPELREAGKLKYSDAVIDYCARFYEPYAENWVLLAPGNHEESYAERHETDMTERLAERLKAKGSPVQVGNVQGCVRFRFHIRASCEVTQRLRYTHGYGGGGPVTRDVIQAQRQLAFLGNVDILVSGHTHDAWHVVARTESLDMAGKPVVKDVDCIKTCGYKDEYSIGRGWAVSKGMPPKPKGAWWVRFWVEGDKILKEFTLAR